MRSRSSWGEQIVLGIIVPLSAAFVCVGILIFATLLGFTMGGGDGARGPVSASVTYAMIGVNLVGNLVSVLVASWLIWRMSHVPDGYRRALIGLYGVIAMGVAILVSFGFLNQGTTKPVSTTSGNATRTPTKGTQPDPTARAHQKVDQILDPDAQ